ncbi:chlorophyll synthase, chloroplastic [Trifolium repens]|nr:chlorophyll synthase, chloroplastic [Trifolium repens]
MLTSSSLSFVFVVVHRRACYYFLLEYFLFVSVSASSLRHNVSVVTMHALLALECFCFEAQCLGIAIVNDFKSVEGDRALGLQSLPVAFGSETAKWICVGAIDITQLSVAGYLLGAGKPYYALALLALIAPQVFFQFKYFLKDPVKYDASAQPFLVLGLLVTALATSH